MRNNKKKHSNKKKKIFGLKTKIKRIILGIFLFLISIVVSLSFFNLAGVGGKILFEFLKLLIGNTSFLIPLVLVILGWIFLDPDPEFQKFSKIAVLAAFFFILGVSGIFASFDLSDKDGGWLGFAVSWPLLKLFSKLVAQIIFGTTTFLSLLIFWRFFPRAISQVQPPEEKPLLSRILKGVKKPKLKIEQIEPAPKVKTKPPEFKTEPILEKKPLPFSYQTPPLELLAVDKEVPHSGDVLNNSAIIKKTFKNFDIEVEMCGVNIGPTVTQYTLKPAEGIKLSKITGLSNNLALALAAHPIRIEAPIPGKSLVGIEVPNKVRAKVRLRNLISDPQFQKSPSNLTLILGRDVSGEPVFTDLARMPHLLVAGATGTGKTIFLNSLILSLLFRNSPQTLRLILVDPKRVEFPVYNDLPHLLAPVILDVDKTVEVLKWLTKEMERRFEVLAEKKVRDISSYNEKAFEEETQPLPYIVLIIDELADLMAAKGKEIEAGIVRLAQLARAVGIHLVVATQRPSVEVITGLIKANITSRVTFQVASQVDSRTILDMAGAEKLLGLGDMLFISAEILKPKRIQGAYVSPKEVKKVVRWIINQVETVEDELSQDLKESLITPEKTETEFSQMEEDPLYEEAKRVVIEAGKASASLLQRKLRIGYARAARIIDMLEERGVVGPLEGAKPRKVYFSKEDLEEF